MEYIWSFWAVFYDIPVIPQLPGDISVAERWLVFIWRTILLTSETSWANIVYDIDKRDS